MSSIAANPEFVIGTPGRLCDLIKNGKNVCLEMIETVVLDEADRLLEMGFTIEV